MSYQVKIAGRLDEIEKKIIEVYGREGFRDRFYEKLRKKVREDRNNFNSNNRDGLGGFVEGNSCTTTEKLTCSITSALTERKETENTEGDGDKQKEKEGSELTTVAATISTNSGNDQQTRTDSQRFASTVAENSDKGALMPDKNASQLENDRRVRKLTCKEKPEINVLSTRMIIKECLKIHQISNAVWNYADNDQYFVVAFDIFDQEQMDQLLEFLRYKGIANDGETSIHIVESHAVFCDMINQLRKLSSNNVACGDTPGKQEDGSPTNSHGQPHQSSPISKKMKKFVAQFRARITIAQVYECAKMKSTVDANYFMHLIPAIFLALGALAWDDSILIIATMLLSPLLNPILSVLFGYMFRDWNILKRGGKILAISLFLCVSIGFTSGFVVFYIGTVMKNAAVPSDLIMQRGNIVNSPMIFYISLFSALSLSNAILDNNMASQIGNAISLSLLPPAVNTGYLLFLSLMAATNVDRLTGRNTTCTYKWTRGPYIKLYYSRADLCYLPSSLVSASCTSFFFTVINIALVLLVGIMVCRFKAIAPKWLLSVQDRKFYEADACGSSGFAASHDTNTSNNHRQSGGPVLQTLKHRDLSAPKLAKELVDDYADIFDKNIDEITPQYKRILINDLKNLTEGVTDGKEYKTVTSRLDSCDFKNDLCKEFKLMDEEIISNFQNSNLLTLPSLCIPNELNLKLQLQSVNASVRASILKDMGNYNVDHQNLQHQRSYNHQEKTSNLQKNSLSITIPKEAKTSVIGRFAIRKAPDDPTRSPINLEMNSMIIS